MTNEDICNFISHRMKVHDNLETICNEVIDTCLYKVSVQVHHLKAVYILSCYREAVTI